MDDKEFINSFRKIKKSGLKKEGHRSHCSSWEYMNKATDKFDDILKDEVKRWNKKYVKSKRSN